MHVQPFQKVFHIIGYLTEYVLGVTNQIHLVDDDIDLANAQQAQHVTMPPGLLLHTLLCIDDKHGCIGIRCTGNHIFEEFLMPWCIDDDVFTLSRRELDLRRVDGNALLLLFLEGIQQIRILKRLSRLFGNAPDLVYSSFRQRLRIIEQAADNR